MNVNITIFIQIVNFLIAYLIIRTLLLKPTVAVILQDEKHRAELDQTLNAIETINQKKEETLDHDWQQCKQEFKKHAPQAIKAEILKQAATESTVEIPSLDKKSVEQMTDQVTDQLKESLSHVH